MEGHKSRDEGEGPDIWDRLNDVTNQLDSILGLGLVTYRKVYSIFNNILTTLRVQTCSFSKIYTCNKVRGLQRVKRQATAISGTTKMQLGSR